MSKFRGSGLENGGFAAHIGAMTEGPKFQSKMVKGGRWAVTIATGYGPSSYVGDFATGRTGSPS